MHALQAVSHDILQIDIPANTNIIITKVRHVEITERVVRVEREQRLVAKGREWVVVLFLSLSLSKIAASQLKGLGWFCRGFADAHLRTWWGSDRLTEELTCAYRSSPTTKFLVTA